MQVLHVVLGGCEHDRLFRGLDHLTQQVQQNGRLVVRSTLQKGELKTTDKLIIIRIN